MNEWVLKEQTHAFISSKQWDTVVLPFAATEPHNVHMPYGADIFQVELVGSKACEYAYKKGANVLLLPAMPYGVNTNHLKVPGAFPLSVTPTTLLKVLADLVDALERRGIKKMLLLNGHGGNELKPLTRELHHRTSMFLCVCDWFKVCADQMSKIFDKPGEHADEMETSMGLAFYPDLMKPAVPGSGKGKSTRFDAINKGWVGVTRPWHLLTEDTGVGDPGAGSAEKGKKLVEMVTQRLGDFLYQLATSKVDEQFPF